MTRPSNDEIRDSWRQGDCEQAIVHDEARLVDYQSGFLAGVDWQAARATSPADDALRRAIDSAAASLRRRMPLGTPNPMGSSPAVQSLLEILCAAGHMELRGFSCEWKTPPPEPEPDDLGAAVDAYLHACDAGSGAAIALEKLILVRERAKRST